MRVMVMIKATRESEAGGTPDPQMMMEMGAFNESLVKAGVMLAGEGLLPSSQGRRIHFAGKATTETTGPLSGDLVAGFWIWKVASLDEAVEWARRIPDPMPGEETDIDIRQIAEAEDFGDAMTPEVKAQEERIRKQLDAKAKPARKSAKAAKKPAKAAKKPAKAAKKPAKPLARKTTNAGKGKKKPARRK